MNFLFYRGAPVLWPWVFPFYRGPTLGGGGCPRFSTIKWGHPTPSLNLEGDHTYIYTYGSSFAKWLEEFLLSWHIGYEQVATSYDGWRILESGVKNTLCFLWKTCGFRWNQVTLPEVVCGNIMYIYIYPLVIKHSHGSHGIFIDGLPFLKMVDRSSSLSREILISWHSGMAAPKEPKPVLGDDPVNHHSSGLWKKKLCLTTGGYFTYLDMWMKWDDAIWVAAKKSSVAWWCHCRDFCDPYWMGRWRSGQLATGATWYNQGI